ncbi:hypothetical protein ACHAO1_002174 [Botrytis cinerea]
MCRNTTPRYWCCHFSYRNDAITPDTPTPAPDCNGKGSSCPSYRECRRKFFQQKQVCAYCAMKLNQSPPVKEEVKKWSKEIFYHKVTSELVDFLNDKRRDRGEQILTDGEKLQVWDRVEGHFDAAIGEPNYAELFAFQFEYFRDDRLVRDVKGRVLLERENERAGKDC